MTRIDDHGCVRMRSEFIKRLKSRRMVRLARSLRSFVELVEHGPPIRFKVFHSLFANDEEEDRIQKREEDSIRKPPGQLDEGASRVSGAGKTEQADRPGRCSRLCSQLWIRNPWDNRQ